MRELKSEASRAREEMSAPPIQRKAAPGSLLGDRGGRSDQHAANSAPIQCKPASPIQMDVESTRLINGGQQARVKNRAENPANQAVSGVAGELIQGPNTSMHEYGRGKIGEAAVAKGVKSMAENPNFEADAKAFEEKLGRNAFNTGHRTSQQLVKNCKDYMTSKAGSWDKDNLELKTMIDKISGANDNPGGDPGWSGSVGTDVEDVMNAFDPNANLGVQMCHVENFYKKVLAPDLMSSKVEDLKTHLDAGRMQVAKIEQKKAQKKLSPYTVDPESEVTGQPTARADAKTAIPGTDTRTSLTTGELASGPEDQQVHLDVAEAQQQFPDKKDDINGPEDIPDDVLQWAEGAKIWALNEHNKWVYMMREMSIPLAAGPSGTTNAIMNGADIIGSFDPYEVRRAIIGYLLTAHHHSLVEVMVASASHGCSDYVQGRGMYRSIEPWSEEELREFGDAGRFPDEMGHAEPELDWAKNGEASPSNDHAQTKSDDAAAHGAPAPQKTSGGRPLPDGLRVKMEAAFGADFSSVRIHEGPEAAQIGAKAYAQGDNLHFAPGHYNPDSKAGQELIGHELAHVVQQRGGRVQAPAQAKGASVVQDPGLEAEADAAGARAAQGGRAGVPGGGGSSTGATAQRQSDDEMDTDEARIVVYRGIHFDTQKYPEDGAKHVGSKNDTSPNNATPSDMGKATLSKAVKALVAAGTPEADAIHQVQEALNAKKNGIPILTWWQQRGIRKDNAYLALIERYVNDCDDSKQEWRDGFPHKGANNSRGDTTAPLKDNVGPDGQNAYAPTPGTTQVTDMPLLSTSKKPEIAAGYATGKNGTKPENRRWAPKYAGQVVGRLHGYVLKPGSKDIQNSIDIQEQQAAGKLNIKGYTLRQAEVTFTGAISANALKAEEDVLGGESEADISERIRKATESAA